MTRVLALPTARQSKVMFLSEKTMIKYEPNGQITDFLSWEIIFGCRCSDLITRLAMKKAFWFSRLFFLLKKRCCISSFDTATKT